MDYNFSYSSRSQNYVVEQHRKNISKVGVVICDGDTYCVMLGTLFELAVSYHYLTYVALRRISLSGSPKKREALFSNNQAVVDDHVD